MAAATHVVPSFGCIVLTEGRRPEELTRSLESLGSQRGVDVDIVVVGNGLKPDAVPKGVKKVVLEQNLGVPGGRNAGVDHVEGDLLLFLDDDARFPDEDALMRIGRMFAEDPHLGAVSPRLDDPDGRPTPRNWVPRVRVGDKTRSSEVASICEAASVIRREAFEAAGRWAAGFYFLHEGIELAWRILDASYSLWYAGDVVALHPAPLRRRGARARYMSSRNRVWLARRNLPLPLAAAHMAVWFVRFTFGLRSAKDAQELLRGYADGLRQPPGDRRRLRWRTIWRMTVVGRPPVI
jgi:GT2 family glycosyltransferase